MRRVRVNLAVNAAAAMALLGLVATGMLLRWVLPPGSGASKVLWGLARHAWGDVHFWLAVAFATACVTHLVLHWTWVVLTCANLGKDCPSVPPARSRAVAGLVSAAAALLLLGGFWLLAESQVQPVPGGGGHGRGAVSADGGGDSREVQKGRYGQGKGGKKGRAPATTGTRDSGE